MHRCGVYPFELTDDLVCFDLTLEIGVSKSSELEIMSIAVFRVLLSVLESDMRLRFRAGDVG